MNNFVKAFRLIDHLVLQCTNCKGLTSVVDNKYNYPCKCGGLMVLIPLQDIAKIFGFETYNDFYNTNVYRYMLCNRCSNYEIFTQCTNVRQMINNRCGHNGCNGRLMLMPRSQFYKN